MEKEIVMTLSFAADTVIEGAELLDVDAEFVIEEVTCTHGTVRTEGPYIFVCWEAAGTIAVVYDPTDPTEDTMVVAFIEGVRCADVSIDASRICLVDGYEPSQDDCGCQ